MRETLVVGINGQRLTRSGAPLTHRLNHDTIVRLTIQRDRDIRELPMLRQELVGHPKPSMALNLEALDELGRAMSYRPKVAWLNGLNGSERSVVGFMLDQLSAQYRDDLLHDQAGLIGTVYRGSKLAIVQLVRVDRPSSTSSAGAARVFHPHRPIHRSPAMATR